MPKASSYITNFATATSELEQKAVLLVESKTRSEGLQRKQSRKATGEEKEDPCSSFLY